MHICGDKCVTICLTWRSYILAWFKDVSPLVRWSWHDHAYNLLSVGKKWMVHSFLFLGIAQLCGGRFALAPCCTMVLLISQWVARGLIPWGRKLLRDYDLYVKSTYISKYSIWDLTASQATSRRYFPNVRFFLGGGVLLVRFHSQRVWWCLWSPSSCFHAHCCTRSPFNVKPFPCWVLRDMSLH